LAKVNAQFNAQVDAQWISRWKHQPNINAQLNALDDV
jgi:hypothetical protein